MIELTPRLKTIADVVLQDNPPLSACDVGTDHGYIPIYLAQNSVKSLIATDISAPSAQKAADNAFKYNLQSIISVRVGNGLEKINDNEAECVIIAGMGGLMITKILSAQLPSGIKKFVLQPMRSEYELRRFLCKNGFSIDKEVLCKDDNRIYTVMSVTYGSCCYDNLSLYYGKFDKTQLYFEYINKKIKSLEKQINGIKTSGRSPEKSIIERYEYLNEIVKRGG